MKTKNQTTVVNQPKILLLTDEMIDMSHGTGAVLLRHLETYLQNNLANICTMKIKDGQPGVGNTLVINRADLVPNGIHRTIRSIRQWLQKIEFDPQVIYSHFYSARGLLLLRHLEESFTRPLPTIQYFHDFRNENGLNIESEIRKTAPYFSETWAVTETIAEKVSDIIGEPVATVSTFRCRIPSEFKKKHADLNKNIHVVMLGNIWLPQLLNDIRDTWKWIQNQTGCVKPISWICHPGTIWRITNKKIDLGQEVKWLGFLPNDQLLSTLQQADFAIVPVNRDKIPEDDYATYSLPSRITELASVGLPMFFAAGPGTETWKFVEKTRIGICSPPSDETEFRSALLSFMQNRGLREEYGRRSRQLAETKFDIDRYRQFLFDKFNTLCTD